MARSVHSGVWSTNRAKSGQGEKDSRVGSVLGGEQSERSVLGDEQSKAWMVSISRILLKAAQGPFSPLFVLLSPK